MKAIILSAGQGSRLGHLVDDDLADRTVEAIENAARTGRIGDGKIFVLDLLAVTRIRTGETGAAAL